MSGTFPVSFLKVYSIRKQGYKSYDDFPSFHIENGFLIWEVPYEPDKMYLFSVFEGTIRLSRTRPGSEITINSFYIPSPFGSKMPLRCDGVMPVPDLETL